PRTAAENSDDEIRIILRQFLHRLRSVINDLQKNGPARFRHARQRANDVVVDELAELFRRDPAGHIWIEHFEEVPELLPLRLLAKLLVPQQRLAVLFQAVEVRNRIKPEVRARKISTVALALDLPALNLINARRTKRLRRLARVA